MAIALDRARGLGALEPTITPNQRTIMNSKMHIGTQPRIEGDPLAIGLGGDGGDQGPFFGLERSAFGRPPASDAPPNRAELKNFPERMCTKQVHHAFFLDRCMAHFKKHRCMVHLFFC